MLQVETVSGGYYNVEAKQGVLYADDFSIYVDVKVEDFEYLLKKLYRDEKIDLLEYTIVYELYSNDEEE